MCSEVSENSIILPREAVLILNLAVLTVVITQLRNRFKFVFLTQFFNVYRNEAQSKLTRLYHSSIAIYPIVHPDSWFFRFGEK